MSNVKIELLKKLRNETQVSLAECRKALEQTNNSYEKAKEWLKQHGIEKAEKKSDRETLQGAIECYIHQNKRVGAIVEVLCETDFVARTEEFNHLTHEIALQVAAMKPKNTDELLKQEYIRDTSMTIEQLVKSFISKLGENMTIKRFERFEIGV